MTTTIAHSADVPVPAGVIKVDVWQDDIPQPYRVLIGDLRGIDGLDIDRVSIQATAVQFSDGRIDDGSVHEAPSVYLGDDPLSSIQARELAAALIATADEIDGWSQR
jgi:hypothetical protein